MPFRWSGDRLAAAWSPLSPCCYLLAITRSNTPHPSSSCTLASFFFPSATPYTLPFSVLLSHDLLPFSYSYPSIPSHFLINFLPEAPNVLCHSIRISPYLGFIYHDHPNFLFSAVTTPSHLLVVVRHHPAVFLLRGGHS